MNFLNLFKFLLFIIIIFSFPISSFAKANFNEIVQQVSKEAEQKGISSKVINEFKNKTKFIKRVVELDKSQPEFKLTLDQYLTRVVTATRIKKANKKYKENKNLLTQISKHYGVQPRFIVALWGIETDFGRLTGGFSVISALTTLVYDGRRYDYFKKELINALKIVNGGHITINKMTGSWAGAMGQCQFMPSSFINYATDWDKDGSKNIWTSKPDVFASAANYLKRVGWSDQITWGRKVFIGNYKGKINEKKYYLLSYWTSKGILKVDKGKLPDARLKARLIIPDGYKNYGYLVYKNFDSLLNWNRSNYFAIAVGTLSNYIKEK
jgi:membrane-bound lytic murein transglycosylase B